MQSGPGAWTSVAAQLLVGAVVAPGASQGGGGGIVTVLSVGHQSSQSLG